MLPPWHACLAKTCRRCQQGQLDRPKFPQLWRASQDLRSLSGRLPPLLPPWLTIMADLAVKIIEPWRAIRPAAGVCRGHAAAEYSNKRGLAGTTVDVSGYSDLSGL